MAAGTSGGWKGPDSRGGRSVWQLMCNGCAVLVVECQCRDVIVWTTIQRSRTLIQLVSFVDNEHLHQGRRLHHGHHRGSAKIRPFLPGGPVSETCLELRVAP